MVKDDESLAIDLASHTVGMTNRKAHAEMGRLLIQARSSRARGLVQARAWLLRSRMKLDRELDHEVGPFEDRIDQLLKDHPELSIDGPAIGTSTKTRSAEFRREAVRKYLLANQELFKTTCRWVSLNLVPVKTINPDAPDSLVLGLMEKEILGLTNGCMFAALLDQGYRYIHNYSGGIRFNISSRSLTRVAKIACERIAAPRRYAIDWWAHADQNWHPPASR